MAQSNLQQILKDLELMKPESQLKVEIDKNLEETIKGLLSAYEQRLAEKIDEWKTNCKYEFYEKCRRQVAGFDISPRAISEFLPYLINYEDEQNFEENTGLFLSALVQASYKKGYNNFEIDLRHIKKTSYVCSKIIGGKKRPLEIILLGNIGKNSLQGLYYANVSVNGSLDWHSLGGAEHCEVNIIGNVKGEIAGGVKNCKVNLAGSADQNFGKNALHSAFYIKGNVDSCGWEAEHSFFEIEGKIKDFCGYKASNSQFKITGNAGRWCGGKSWESAFYINGDAGPELGDESSSSFYSITGKADKDGGQYATNCIYKCASRETALKLKKQLCNNTKVYLVENGIKFLFAEGKK